MTARARALLAEARRRQALAPLAYADLWHHSPPRTSQREALRMMSAPGVLLGLCVGGNRTGKSELAAMYAILCAAGRDAVIRDGRREVPWVRRFLARAGLPEGLIRPAPCEVWVASPTFAAARKQIRPKIRRWLPAGSRYRSWNSDSEAEAVIAGTGGKGLITSKAYRQYDHDDQTWEGAAIGGLICDEQPNSYDCLAAGLSRLVDLEGQAFMSVTPLRGTRDWLYEELVRAAPPWVAMRTLHGADNPHISEEMRQLMLSSQPEWSRASRDRGVFGDVEGRIYPFSRGAHVVPACSPPSAWPRIVAVDWGSRAPHVLWIAESPAGQLIVYRELAPRIELTAPGLTSRRLVSMAIDAETHAGDLGGEVYRVADSEDPGAIAEAAELGWWVAPAVKGPGSVTRGITLVEALLQTIDPITGELVAPRLVVTEDCPVLIEELENYRHHSRSSPENVIPVKRDDHGADALRYAVQYRAQYSGL